MSDCKPTPRKNVQLVNRPSENTANESTNHYDSLCCGGADCFHSILVEAVAPHAIKQLVLGVKLLIMFWKAIPPKPRHAMRTSKLKHAGNEANVT